VENDYEIYCAVFRKRHYLGDVIVRCTKKGDFLIILVVISFVRSNLQHELCKEKPTWCTTYS